MLDKFSLCSSELTEAVCFILTSIDREGLTLRLHSCVRGPYLEAAMNLLTFAVVPMCANSIIRDLFYSVRPSHRLCTAVH